MGRLVSGGDVLQPSGPHSKRPTRSSDQPFFDRFDVDIALHALMSFIFRPMNIDMPSFAKSFFRAQSPKERELQDASTWKQWPGNYVVIVFV